MSTSFDPASVKMLHIEITTDCQAACPQCARENPKFYDPEKNRSRLTLSQIKQMFSTEFVAQLEKILLCGTFGDPAASSHTLSLLRWVRSINPNISIGINTNGGLRSPTWWHELAEIMTLPKDYVVFSIDGLEDTNHIYRQQVVWYKVMRNAAAFIKNGGNAHWDMLIFKHNEHQVSACEQLARQMGFKWFRAKVSNRLQTRPIEFLQPPQGWAAPQLTLSKEIQCHAMKERSLYVAANGKILPCCFIGLQIFDQDMALRSALNTPNFQAVADSWQHDPLPVCVKHCAVSHSRTNFDQQFRKEVAL